jgi:hypothetical protein
MLFQVNGQFIQGTVIINDQKLFINRILVEQKTYSERKNNRKVLAEG